MNLVALLLTLIVGFFILVGCVFGVYMKNNKSFTDFSVSVAFGVIICLIIFEIIPESYEVLSMELGIVRAIISIILVSLIGMILLKILDIFVPCHEHESHHEHSHKNDNCHNEHLKHIGIVSSIAVIIHNLIEGMSLYLVSSSNIISGLLLCIGIGLHNIPMGLVISSTLINSGYSKKKIINYGILISLSTFIGGLVLFFTGSFKEIVTGILLSLTLGMLIYIDVFELFHQIYHMKSKKICICGISIGIIILLISILMEHIIG